MYMYIIKLQSIMSNKQHVAHWEAPGITYWVLYLINIPQLTLTNTLYFHIMVLLQIIQVYFL